MTLLHRILSSAAILATLGFFFVPIAHGQAPTYYRGLLYSMPSAKSVPPLYPGQPPQVTTAYLWLDDLMRLAPEYAIEDYINSLSWGDTLQTIASNLYQIQDDNPLSYYNWNDAGIYPHVYKGAPGQAEAAMILHLMHIADGANPCVFLSSMIIADVTVSDTECFIDPTAQLAKDAVLVNCVINDEIKGKWVPACPLSPGSRKKGAVTLGSPTPASPALPADTAALGTCLQFQYSPEWKQNPYGESSPQLGWWIKPGQEYIVFLSFTGVAYNSGIGYFTTEPAGPFGHCCGMFPVVGGVVQYPYDDFGLGGTNLTLSAWKAALRAKINALVNP